MVEYKNKIYYKEIVKKKKKRCGVAYFSKQKHFVKDIHFHGRMKM